MKFCAHGVLIWLYHDFHHFVFIFIIIYCWDKAVFRRDYLTVT
jgi:hypothetical protein